MTPTDSSVSSGLFHTPLTWSMRTTVFARLLALTDDVVEKYNAIPKETNLSSEDVEAVEELRQGLLSIASALNLSIVDPTDVSSILDVLEEELRSMKSEMKDGKISALPWKLEELPITITTESKYFIYPSLSISIHNDH